MTRLRQYLPDVLMLAGFSAIGTGVAHWSRPAALVYAGLVLLGIGYAAASVRRRPR